MRVFAGYITAMVVTILGVGAMWMAFGPSSTRAAAIPASQIRIGRSLGSPRAAQKVDLYVDFRDDDYLTFAAGTLNGVIDRYVSSGDVNVTIHYFPGSDGRTIGEAHWAAEAAECANEQERFWAFHDRLVTTYSGARAGTSTFTRDQLLLYAKEMGVFQMDQFSQCLITDKYASLVDDDLVTARNLRVNKAPAFVVNGVLAPVAGPNISELSKYLHIDSPAF